MLVWLGLWIDVRVLGRILVILDGGRSWNGFCVLVQIELWMEAEPKLDFCAFLDPVVDGGILVGRIIWTGFLSLSVLDSG